MIGRGRLPTKSGKSSVYPTYVGQECLRSIEIPILAYRHRRIVGLPGRRSSDEPVALAERDGPRAAIAERHREPDAVAARAPNQVAVLRLVGQHARSPAP